MRQVPGVRVGQWSVLSADTGNCPKCPNISTIVHNNQPTQCRQFIPSQCTNMPPATAGPGPSLRSRSVGMLVRLSCFRSWDELIMRHTFSMFSNHKNRSVNCVPSVAQHGISRLLLRGIIASTCWLVTSHRHHLQHLTRPHSGELCKNFSAKRIFQNYPKD